MARIPVNVSVCLISLFTLSIFPFIVRTDTVGLCNAHTFKAPNRMRKYNKISRNVTVNQKESGISECSGMRKYNLHSVLNFHRMSIIVSINWFLLFFFNFDQTQFALVRCDERQNYMDELPNVITDKWEQCSLPILINFSMLCVTSFQAHSLLRQTDLAFQTFSTSIMVHYHSLVSNILIWC